MVALKRILLRLFSYLVLFEEVQRCELARKLLLGWALRVDIHLALSAVFVLGNVSPQLPAAVAMSVACCSVSAPHHGPLSLQSNKPKQAFSSLSCLWSWCFYHSYRNVTGRVGLGKRAFRYFYRLKTVSGLSHREQFEAEVNSDSPNLKQNPSGSVAG